MAALAPCTSCHRHVRLDGPACPFCGAALDGVAAPPAPPPGLARLGRAAIFAFGASVGASGCFVALYGAPAPDDAGPVGVLDAAVMDDGGGLDAAYGGPPPIDAGADGGPAADDAGPTDDGGTAAAYGTPP